MQVFRIVTGAADKVIAFDELPDRLVQGLEMREPVGFPRHWKSFLGKKKKFIKGAVYKRLGTQDQVVPDSFQEGPFFYMIDPQKNSDDERWQEIISFVKRVVPPEIKLYDKIEDMALPLAVDARAELSLEPEHLEEKGAIIPIPEEYQEKSAEPGKAAIHPVNEIIDNMLKCDECEKKFSGKQALSMHKMRIHKGLGGRKKEVA